MDDDNNNKIKERGEGGRVDSEGKIDGREEGKKRGRGREKK